MKFIKQLLEIWTCKHDWHVHARVYCEVYDDTKGTLNTREVLFCKKCPKIKTIHY